MNSIESGTEVGSLVVKLEYPMKRFNMTSVLLLAVAGSILAGNVQAQETDAMEIDRTGTDLRSEVAVRPNDRVTTDTAVVATNTSGRPARVMCAALDSNGNALGRAAMRVPAKGLRYLRASDLSNGRDYVGQVRCRTGNEGVQGSAFLLGPAGVSDLPVLQRGYAGDKHIIATVTASF